LGGKREKKTAGTFGHRRGEVKRREHFAWVSSGEKKGGRRQKATGRGSQGGKGGKKKPKGGGTGGWPRMRGRAGGVAKENSFLF